LFTQFSHHLHNKIARPSSSQERPAFEAAKRNEMQISFSVMSFRFLGISRKGTAHPFFQKGQGTPVLSPHGELRKWHPLLVPLHQAEKPEALKLPPAKTAEGLTVITDSITSDLPVTRPQWTNA
jgi:hypothetical protein